MGIISNMRWLFSRQPYYLPSPTFGGTVEICGCDTTPEEIYRTQPNVKTVVDFVARNIGELPLKVYRIDASGDKVRDRECALAKLLKEPNPDKTTYELVRDLVSYFLLYDEEHWVVGRDAESESGWSIRDIPTSWITGREGDGFSLWRISIAQPNAAPVDIEADSLVSFVGFNPGSPRDGSPAIRALMDTIKEQRSAQGFRRDVWERGMRVTGYLKRPATVQEWKPEARNRFITAIRENWGRNGKNAGGTPVFEDGMEYHPVEFNAREKDWAEGVRLSREEVSAAFFVNPALIWHTEGQTYASAKDNARALYADTLAPLLSFITQRINKRLPAMLGEPDRFCEFDLQAKLQGSFEEQASSLQTSVGAPWMSRAEARRRMNLPYIEGTDELITPLNVLVGGLASPTDTDPTQARYQGAPEPAAKSEPVTYEVKAADDTDISYYADTLKRFFERQGRTVLSALGAKAESGWWDEERWNRELADDLTDDITNHVEASAYAALAALGFAPELFNRARCRAFIAAMAKMRAERINEATRTQIQTALDGDIGEDALKSTPEGVFEEATTTRYLEIAATIATAAKAFGGNEAGKQAAQATGSRVTKTWVTGTNPRPSHAAMSGQTVNIWERFSNGADWPGDQSALDVADIANCNCRVVITKY